MKPNTVYKRAYNLMLVRLADFSVGAELGSEPFWAQTVGVSRTTIRLIFANFARTGVIVCKGRNKVLTRSPAACDYFNEDETKPVGLIVEKRFMQWILHGDCKPGEQINGLELSRKLGVSTSAIRDYLIRFSRFGLLQRGRNGSWVFKGFTEEFAEELFEVRRMFELRSAQRFIALASEDPAWTALLRIRDQHLVLLDEAAIRYSDFSELDERFHRCINDASRNRFIVNFYDIISMIFHYHYQWNKRDEKERNIAAIKEHLTYIAALLNRDAQAVEKSCLVHMATARETMRAAIGVPQSNSLSAPTTSNSGAISRNSMRPSTSLAS